MLGLELLNDLVGVRQCSVQPCGEWIVLRSIDWYCILAMAIGTVNIYNGSLLLSADVVKAEILLSSSSAEVNNISLSLGSGI